jgi:hypothetical protein
MEFIDPGADRFRILQSLLNDELSLGASTLELSGNRHILVPSFQDRLSREGIVLAAHYDRAAGSPGANDNSAAVFQLIETAAGLRKKRIPDWMVIFTDKEELVRGEGIRDQGSYALARDLQRRGFENPRVFIFDACGTGDTLIISTTADQLMKDETGPGIAKTRRMVRGLRNRALEAARDLRMDKVLLLPTPFSDDAGFLRAGLAAQTITVLPAREAGPFASLLRNRPGFARGLVSREVQDTQDRRLIPETWRVLNGPGDSHLRLTPPCFKKVARFAAALCGG